MEITMNEYVVNISEENFEYLSQILFPAEFEFKEKAGAVKTNVPVMIDGLIVGYTTESISKVLVKELDQLAM